MAAVRSDEPSSTTSREEKPACWRRDVMQAPIFASSFLAGTRIVVAGNSPSRSSRGACHRKKVIRSAMEHSNADAIRETKRKFMVDLVHTSLDGNQGRCSALPRSSGGMPRLY